MRYFLYVSLLFLAALVACRPKLYRNLQVQTSTEKLHSFSDPEQLKVHFDRLLYSGQVYGKTPLGKRFHLSGLLFFKQMEDGGQRVVFQNQMGVSFFDFGWDTAGKFTVYQVMDQMNKPALIKTLKKDFEFLLYRNLKTPAAGLYYNPSGMDYLKYELEKGFVYYIFDQGNIVQIENADDKRKVVTIDLEQAKGRNTLAERIRIKHLRANFSIDLSKIQEENNTVDDITEE